jgi:hypothetical protein
MDRTGDVRRVFCVSGGNGWSEKQIKEKLNDIF